MNVKYLLIVPFLLSFFIIGKTTAQGEWSSESKYDDLALLSSNKSKSSVKEKSSYSNTRKAKESESLKGTDFYQFNPTPFSSKSYHLPQDMAYKWYIQAGAGAQLLMGEDDDKGSFGSRITFAPALTGGYRWNPIFGVRLNVTGGSLHGLNDGHAGTYRFWKGKSEDFKINYAKEHGFYDAHGLNEIERWDPQWGYKGWDLDNGQIFYDQNKGAEGYHWVPGRPDVWGVKQQFYMQHVRYIAANAAITMNLFNLFGGVDETRKFDASLHLGPTMFHVLPHMGVQSYTGFGWNGGIQGQYHLNKTLALFIEFNGSAMPDGFDGHYGGDTFDLVGQTLAGITYKFAIGETWRKPTPPVVIDDKLKKELDDIRREKMSEIDLDDLQPEIDRLRAMLDGLNTKTTEYIDPDKKDFFLPTPVYFEINKSIIRDTEWKAIADAADYLRKYPTATVTVTGYADKDTGTRSINERLSRERSQKVADTLINKHGISRNRISIDWRGDTVQPFYRNNMNRSVLFRIIFKDK